MYEVSDDHGAALLIREWGFVPASLTTALRAESPLTSGLQDILLTAITAQFLHAGWVHVLGNLLYLRVFGDNVECKFGPIAYFAFFIGGGVAGLAAQYAFDPTSELPIIGASGAISAVLGAYIVLFPGSRIVTLLPVLIFLTFVEIPAAVFLGVWVLQQLLNGFLAFEGTTDQVAWFAHLGGFTWGLVMGTGYRLSFARRRPRSDPARTA